MSPTCCTALPQDTEHQMPPTAAKGLGLLMATLSMAVLLSCGSQDTSDALGVWGGGDAQPRFMHCRYRHCYSARHIVGRSLRLWSGLRSGRIGIQRRHHRHASRWPSVPNRWAGSCMELALCRRSLSILPHRRAVERWTMHAKRATVRSRVRTTRWASKRTLDGAHFKRSRESKLVLGFIHGLLHTGKRVWVR
jgi:hypothetical protein